MRYLFNRHLECKNCICYFSRCSSVPATLSTVLQDSPFPLRKWDDPRDPPNAVFSSFCYIFSVRICLLYGEHTPPGIISTTTIAILDLAFALAARTAVKGLLWFRLHTSSSRWRTGRSPGRGGSRPRPRPPRRRPRPRI